MDDTTRAALRQERIDILAGMVQDLRTRLAAAERDNARLRGALEKIAAGNPGKPRWLSDIEMANIARTVLEG